ncbi:uncharacterized protein LOC134532131 isoform X2 [Bacillus rossius redtenbacheri]|uniref:uncharacterized protein LOC134532131 isoform X2 n=1 Tax=Bacillus rossius redtenbacheri TaxID=93214 RepID=UPI002FDD3C03
MVDSAARRWKVVLACGWCQGVVLAVVQNFALLAAALFSRLQMSATDTGLLLNCHAGVSCLSAVGAGLLLASTGVALGAGCGGAVLAAAGAAPVAAPALVSGLLARYGLQGAALLCGGVCLHCVAAALLLRPEHRGKSTSKEGGQSKDSQPTVRRGTIVPVMKIDAPEDEEKQDGRRPSSASSGPRRRGTPGWRPRQSVGSLHSGSSAGMFEDEASRSQRSSRSSSIALEPPRLHRPAGQESSVGAHSKKLDVPNLAQRGDRRGSTLSAGSHRRSQRSSLASLLSAGSSLAVVLDEHEEDGLLGARAPEERRSSGVSARSSSLEVPGEQVPGGSGGQRPWWGRLSVGSVCSGGGSRVFGARSPSLVSGDSTACLVRERGLVAGGSGGQRPWWGRLSVGSVCSGGGSRVFGARSPSLVSGDSTACLVRERGLVAGGSGGRDPGGAACLSTACALEEGRVCSAPGLRAWSPGTALPVW